MSRSKVMDRVKLTKFDDLFGAGGNEMREDIKEIPLSELHSFRNHPFKIRSDEELAEMIESIREHGVLVPGIARKRKEGGYEIIVGHTRKHVCELVGMETMPMIIQELDDDEASIFMVDSNIQRENILPSEKAKAYKIKYDAMKNQGRDGNSLKIIADENSENYKAVQRYIWIARLNDDFLDMLDKKKIGLMQGVCLSFLTEEEQAAVYEVVTEQNIKLSVPQAEEIKKLSMEGRFDIDALNDCLALRKPATPKKHVTLKINNEKLAGYFDYGTTEDEMVETIFSLLENWRLMRGGGDDE